MLRRIIKHSERTVVRSMEVFLDNDSKVRTRYDDFFGKDFMPLIRHEQTQGAKERIAYATEFAAFQLGQIDKRLARLIELMEAQQRA
jgi:hypothetical protein